MRKYLILGVAIILAAPTVASAAQEQAAIFGFPTGYTSINPTSCKFLHPEVDVKPNALERYARAEDIRDDVLFQCIRKLAVKANKPQPPSTPQVDHCWDNPVPQVHIIRKDDWVGVQELRDYVAAVQACELAR